jgi:Domain of unknown function (DUF1887)
MNMAKKKALLTLFGGRSFLPTALLVIHEKPDIVVAISSEQSYSDLPQLRQAIEKFQADYNFTCVLETPDGIDAFAVTKIQMACEDAIKRHSDVKWIFDITGGTALMSIAAYETARSFKGTQKTPISCWYLNTAHTRVISLVGKQRKNSIFHISVDGYATAYKHTLQKGLFEGIQNNKPDWLHFAQKLGQNPHKIQVLKVVMNKVSDRPAINTPKSYSITEAELPDKAYELLEDAQQVGLMNLLSRSTDGIISFKLTYIQDKFLNGAWLEAYVWNEARQIMDKTGQQPLFDDCQWNQGLEGITNNELDVALTYKAQLLIAECKTGEKGTFASDTIYKWDSVANSLGGKFVGRLLITSLNPSEAIKEDSFKDFLARADSKGVVVVTRDELPNIGKILKQEALKPTFPRI